MKSVRGLNPIVLLMGFLLGGAVLFSLGASIVAVRGADAELPEQYHWEGAQFDRDVARAQRAVDLDAQAVLELAAPRVCRVRLELKGEPPQVLRLTIVHATQPGFDRSIDLARSTDGYRGACGPVGSGHYHVQLSDASASWSIRGESDGTMPLALRAHRLGS